jgi:AcrR family transcriptional regulator
MGPVALQTSFEAPVKKSTTGRREARKTALREKIYETARELFLTHGFEATTITQIAEAADIAPATFFNHFTNKSAVLHEMTGEIAEHLQALVDQQLERPVRAQERIHGFADAVANDIAAAEGLARDVLLELMRSQTRRDQVAPYLSPVYEPFARIISEGQAAGEVRTDFDARFLAEMVLGALNVAFNRWMEDAEFPLLQWLLQAADFICEAIEPRAQ